MSGVGDVAAVMMWCGCLLWCRCCDDVAVTFSSFLLNNHKVKRLHSDDCCFNVLQFDDESDDEEGKHEKTPAEIEEALQRQRGDQFGVELMDIVGTTRVWLCCSLRLTTHTPLPT